MIIPSGYYVTKPERKNIKKPNPTADSDFEITERIPSDEMMIVWHASAWYDTSATEGTQTQYSYKMYFFSTPALQSTETVPEIHSEPEMMAGSHYVLLHTPRLVAGGQFGIYCEKMQLNHMLHMRLLRSWVKPIPKKKYPGL